MLEELRSGVKMREGRKSDLKDRSKGLTSPPPSKQQKKYPIKTKRREKEKERWISLRDTWNNNKISNCHIIKFNLISWSVLYLNFKYSSCNTWTKYLCIQINTFILLQKYAKVRYMYVLYNNPYVAYWV